MDEMAAEREGGSGDERRRDDNSPAPALLRAGPRDDVQSWFQSSVARVEERSSRIGSKPSLIVLLLWRSGCRAPRAGPRAPGRVDAATVPSLIPQAYAISA